MKGRSWGSFWSCCRLACIAGSCGVAVNAAVVQAQRVASNAPTGVSMAASFAEPSQGRRDDPPGRRRQGGTRALRIASSAGGMLLGIVAGATTAVRVLPTDCNCDDPGLRELVYGGFVGSAIGAAVGAAAPELGSSCSLDKRFGRGLAGAGAGAALGFFLGGGMRIRMSEATLYLIPLGSVGGAIAAMGKC